MFSFSQLLLYARACGDIWCARTRSQTKLQMDSHVVTVAGEEEACDVRVWGFGDFHALQA
jgi:hypothetical protein